MNEGYKKLEDELVEQILRFTSRRGWKIEYSVSSTGSTTTTYDYYGKLSISSHHTLAGSQTIICDKFVIPVRHLPKVSVALGELETAQRAEALRSLVNRLKEKI